MDRDFSIQQTVLLLQDRMLYADHVQHTCCLAYLPCFDLQVFHPTGRWAAEIIRMLGGAVVHDMDSDNCKPVTFLSFNFDTPGQSEVKKVDENTWTVTVDYVGSPGHELGWTPDGKKCE